MDEPSVRDPASRTRDWLENRYRHGVEEDRYIPFQPIFGYGERSEQGQTTKYARLLQILKHLGRLSFTSMLDVGGAEGFTAHLARRILGAEAVCSDISVEACRRSREFFDLPAVSLSACALPFADDSFDVVLISEVLEHVEDPGLAVLEGLRVCRLALVVTTDEVCLSETERRRRLAMVDHTRPHTERTYFTPADFMELLGADLTLQASMHIGTWDGTDPDPEDRQGLCDLILRMTRDAPLRQGSLGLLAVREKVPGVLRERPRIKPSVLLERILSEKAPRSGTESSAITEAGPRTDEPSLPSELTARLRCPACLGGLETAPKAPTTGGTPAAVGAETASAEDSPTPSGDTAAGESAAMRCAGCGARYPVLHGVPVLHGEAGAAAGRLEGPRREAYDRVQRRFRSVHPISEQPMVIGGVEALEGLVDAGAAFEDGQDPFFAWGLQRLAFRLAAGEEAAGFAITLCSHQLHPPLSMTVNVGGEPPETFTLAYGWQRLIISIPPRVGPGPAVAVAFDRPMSREELAANHETVRGAAQMPGEAAVRVNAIQRITPLDLLREEVTASTVRAERLEWEIRRLAERQHRLEQLFPVRLYKKWRGMDW